MANDPSVLLGNDMNIVERMKDFDGVVCVRVYKFFGVLRL